MVVNSITTNIEIIICPLGLLLWNVNSRFNGVNFKQMKKPYVTRFERQLIKSKTLTGDCIMLRFRLKQLEKAIIKTHIGSIFYKFL